MSQFKKEFNLQQRIAKHTEAKERFNKKTPDKFTFLIVEPYYKDAVTLPKLNNYKFKVENTHTLGELIFRMKRHFDKPIAEHDQLFIFTAEDKMSFPVSTLIKDIATKHKDTEDGFLYLIYTQQATFGQC